jgi:hypothetical protein
MFFLRPLHWYHSRADLIWPDGFMKYYEEGRTGVSIAVTKSLFLLIAEMDPVPYPGFLWPKIGRNLHPKIFLYFFHRNGNLLISIKDAQASGEAFSPQREHPALQNMKFLYFFLYFFVGNFFPPGSGSGSSNSNNADPDPKPCFSATSISYHSNLAGFFLKIIYF